MAGETEVPVEIIKKDDFVLHLRSNVRLYGFASQAEADGLFGDRGANFVRSPGDFGPDMATRRRNLARVYLASNAAQFRSQFLDPSIESESRTNFTADTDIAGNPVNVSPQADIVAYRIFQMNTWEKRYYLANARAPYFLPIIPEVDEMKFDGDAVRYIETMFPGVLEHTVQIYRRLITTPFPGGDSTKLTPELVFKQYQTALDPQYIIDPGATDVEERAKLRMAFSLLRITGGVARANAERMRMIDPATGNYRIDNEAVGLSGSDIYWSGAVRPLGFPREVRGTARTGAAGRLIAVLREQEPKKAEDVHRGFTQEVPWDGLLKAYNVSVAQGIPLVSVEEEKGVLAENDQAILNLTTALVVDVKGAGLVNREKQIQRAQAIYEIANKLTEFGGGKEILGFLGACVNKYRDPGNYEGTTATPEKLRLRAKQATTLLTLGMQILDERKEAPPVDSWTWNNVVLPYARNTLEIPFTNEQAAQIDRVIISAVGKSKRKDQKEVERTVKNLLNGVSEMVGLKPSFKV